MIEDSAQFSNLNPEVYSGYSFKGKLANINDNNNQFILQMEIDSKDNFVYLTKQAGEAIEHTEEWYIFLKKILSQREKGKRIFSKLFDREKAIFIKNLENKLENEDELTDEEESVAVYIRQTYLRKRYSELLLESELTENIILNENISA